MSEYCPEHTCRFVLLRPSGWYRLRTMFRKNRQGLFPKVSKVVKYNKKTLMGFDALVATDFSLRHLMKKDVDRKVRYICTFHGAGDRAYGFSERRKAFDFLLIPGKSSWDRLFEKKIVNDQNARIVGYSKFDLVLDSQSSSKRLFDNDKLTFMFNPHFEDGLSSWNHWGNRVLEYFYNNPAWNLIFAPHVMLFNKKKNPIAEKYYHAGNIIVDYSSGALMDMTYTINSDVYIGDVSSQVYEFLYRPRPCIFLNPHGFIWKGDPSFKMWNLGDVVENFLHFDGAVQRAVQHHGKYIRKQIEQIEYKFSKSPAPASRRAAHAITDFLNNRH